MTDDSWIPEAPCHKCKQFLQTSFPTPATDYISLGRRLISLVSLMNSLNLLSFLSILGLRRLPFPSSRDRIILEDTFTQHRQWFQKIILESTIRVACMMSTWDNAQVKYLNCFCPHSPITYLGNKLIVFLDTDKWCQSRTDASLRASMRRTKGNEKPHTLNDRWAPPLDSYVLEKASNWDGTFFSFTDPFLCLDILGELAFENSFSKKIQEISWSSVVEK